MWAIYGLASYDMCRLLSITGFSWKICILIYISQLIIESVTVAASLDISVVAWQNFLVWKLLQSIRLSLNEKSPTIIYGGVYSNFQYIDYVLVISFESKSDSETTITASHWISALRGPHAHLLNIVRKPLLYILIQNRVLKWWCSSMIYLKFIGFIELFRTLTYRKKVHAKKWLLI